MQPPPLPKPNKPEDEFPPKLSGCLFGGIVVPGGLLLLSWMVLGDIGGPCLWPLGAIAGGVAGYFSMRERDGDAR